MNILYIGSFGATSFCESSNKNNSGHISGTVISLKNTLSSLRYLYPNFQIHSLDTNLLRFYSGSFIQLFGHVCFLIRYFIKACISVYRSDSVIFNSSPHGFFYLSPLIFVCILLRRNYALRCFGGRKIFDVPLPHRLFNRLTIAFANVIFLQTQISCSSLKAKCQNANIVWLPTARSAPDVQFIKNQSSLGTNFSRRFIYMGHIREDKGITYLINAFKHYLPPSYTLHLYGPIWAELNSTQPYELHSLISGVENIQYKGVVEPDEVLGILSTYDCLVFPTVSIAEGYPGIVIEALSIGLPVIASRWPSLVEILDSSNSLLVQPNSSSSISQAIEKYSSSELLRKNLHFGSLKSFARFNLEEQTKTIINNV